MLFSSPSVCEGIARLKWRDEWISCFQRIQKPCKVRTDDIQSTSRVFDNAGAVEQTCATLWDQPVSKDAATRTVRRIQDRDSANEDPERQTILPLLQKCGATVWFCERLGNAKVMS